MRVNDRWSRMRLKAGGRKGLLKNVINLASISDCRELRSEILPHGGRAKIYEYTMTPTRDVSGGDGKPIRQQVWIGNRGWPRAPASGRGYPAQPVLRPRDAADPVRVRPAGLAGLSMFRTSVARRKPLNRLTPARHAGIFPQRDVKKGPCLSQVAEALMAQAQLIGIVTGLIGLITP